MTSLFPHRRLSLDVSVRPQRPEAITAPSLQSPCAGSCSSPHQAPGPMWVSSLSVEPTTVTGPPHSQPCASLTLLGATPPPPEITYAFAPVCTMVSPTPTPTLSLMVREDRDLVPGTHPRTLRALGALWRTVGVQSALAASERQGRSWGQHLPPATPFLREWCSHPSHVHPHRPSGGPPCPWTQASGPGGPLMEAAKRSGSHRPFPLKLKEWRASLL